MKKKPDKCKAMSNICCNIYQAILDCAAEKGLLPACYLETNFILR